MKKKLLTLLLAAAMVLSLVACGEKKPAPGKDATATEPVVILHTNDVHGAIENYAKVAALADKYEAEGAYVLVLDAGDFSQGTSYVSLSEGATAIELMNMMGYGAGQPRVRLRLRGTEEEHGVRHVPCAGRQREVQRRAGL